MVRTQIQLTPEQSRRLKKVAARKHISVAEVIRQSIDLTLVSDDIPDMNEVRARARSVFGKYQDSAADVAKNHDQYLSEGFSS